MNANTSIRPRERDAILQSLRAGVVPRVGLHHIQVGRAREVQALLHNIERIADGGAAIRLIVGEYGSGKTFFLHLIRTVALEKGLVTTHADLIPDRRLQATSGQARNLYTELSRNLATRTKWDGGALPSIVERFVTMTIKNAKETNRQVEAVIHDRLQQLSELVGGYDFAEVIAAYWRGHDTGDEPLKANAVRWLRGEFTTKTEARAALGVRSIIDDATVYDQLKLLARFIRLAGYSGLLISIDELVNLSKLANTRVRNANYEQVLRILNDGLQGTAEGIGFVFGITPEALLDTRRGLYSYTALQSRLAENAFAKIAGVHDVAGPVIRLANLTPEDLYVLVVKLRQVYAAGEMTDSLFPDEALTAFLAHCSQRIGEAYFRTPRNTIRAFLDLLAVLEHHRHLDWRTLLGQLTIPEDRNPDLEPLPEESEVTDNPTPVTEATVAMGGTNDELSTLRL